VNSISKWVFAESEETAPAAALRDVGRLDVVLALCLGVAGAAISLFNAAKLGALLYTERSFDIWFQADTPRVIANLLDGGSNQYRANIHPLFAILFTPWASALGGLVKDPLQVAHAIVTACAALSAIFLYLALRFARIERLQAALFTGAFLVSAAFLHWYSVIELAPFNGLSICAALLLLSYGRTRSKLWWVVGSMLTLGMTITNWSAGLAATVARWPLKRAILISLAALITTGLLGGVQRLAYPTAGIPFSPRRLLQEHKFAGAPEEKSSPRHNLQVALLYSAVAPKSVTGSAVNPDVVRTPPLISTFITNQDVEISGLGAAGKAAALLWAGLLGCGLWSSFRRPELRPIAIGLGLMLAFQVALDVVYGNVTFLYATNILPMLVFLAALSSLSLSRFLVVPAIAGFIVLAGINNFQTFGAAVELASGLIQKGGNEVWDRYAAGKIILPLSAAQTKGR
jgi:hypothetical protein